MPVDRAGATGFGADAVGDRSYTHGYDTPVAAAVAAAAAARRDVAQGERAWGRVSGLDSGGNAGHTAGSSAGAVVVHGRYGKGLGPAAVILPGAPGAQARAGQREAPGPIAAAVAAKRAQEQGLPAPGGGGFTDFFVDLPAVPSNRTYVVAEGGLLPPTGRTAKQPGGAGGRTGGY